MCPESCWETRDDTSLVKLTHIRCHSKFSFYDATISFLVETEQSNSYVLKKTATQLKWSRSLMYLSLLWRPRFKEKGFCKITELFKLQEAVRINGSVQEYFLLVIFFFPLCSD